MNLGIYDIIYDILYMIYDIVYYICMISDALLSYEYVLTLPMQRGLTMPVTPLELLLPGPGQPRLTVVGRIRQFCPVHPLEPHTLGNRRYRTW